MRSIARQQQSVSLSSCEAELYALQAVSQESVAFSQFCQSVYVGLGEMQPRSVPKILLGRHVEIRLAWVKSKMASGELEIEHRAGTDNAADLFTKCLSTKDFFYAIVQASVLKLLKCQPGILDRSMTFC